MKTTQLTKEQAETFYAEHKDRPFFQALATFMSSGPIVAMHLSSPDAIKKWRALIGPTNTQKAKEEAPDSLRARFGTDGTKNACHGSDSPSSAQRELTFFFPSCKTSPAYLFRGFFLIAYVFFFVALLASVKDPLAVRNKLNEMLYPTLTEGLSELAKAKPADPVVRNCSSSNVLR